MVTNNNTTILTTVALISFGIITFLIYYFSNRRSSSPSPIEPPPVPEPPIPRPPTPNPDIKKISILIIGETNAANTGTTISRSRYSKVFFNGTLYPQAVDPLPGNEGSNGTIWSRLGNLFDASKFDVTFIPTARLNGSINRWLPNSNDYFDRVRNSVLQFKDITHVIWQHGDSDVSMPPLEYKEKFRIIANELNYLTKNAPIYIALNTFCKPYFSTPGDQNNLRINQKQLQSEYNAGPDLDAITDRLECFFNEKGLELAAQQWFKSLNIV